VRQGTIASDTQEGGLCAPTSSRCCRTIVSDMELARYCRTRRRTDDELAGFNRFEPAPYFLHDANTVPHWGGLSRRLNARYGPKSDPHTTGEILMTASVA